MQVVEVCFEKRQLSLFTPLIKINKWQSRKCGFNSSCFKITTLSETPAQEQRKLCAIYKPSMVSTIAGKLQPPSRLYGLSLREKQPLWGGDICLHISLCVCMYESVCVCVCMRVCVCVFM